MQGPLGRGYAGGDQAAGDVVRIRLFKDQFLGRTQRGCSVSRVRLSSVKQQIFDNCHAWQWRTRGLDANARGGGYGPRYALWPMWMTVEPMTF